MSGYPPVPPPYSSGGDVGYPPPRAPAGGPGYPPPAPSAPPIGGGPAVNPLAPPPSAPTGPPRPSAAAAAAAPGVPQDRLLVEDAIKNKIPAWTARLQKVFAAPVVISLDFNAITRGLANDADRLKVIRPAVLGVPRLGGLVADPAAVEQFVRGVEAALVDPACKREVLAAMPSLRVTFVNGNLADADAPSLAFADGELRYTAAFAHGPKGVVSQAQVETFFELNFYAKERVLVGHCMATTVPDVTAQLRRVTRRRDFALDFNLERLLAGVSAKEKRLDTARVLVSQVGMTRKIDAASKMAEQGINNAAAALEAGLTGENEQFRQDGARIDREVYASPNVLRPLVQAIEAQCAVPDVAAAFAGAVRGVHFDLLPPGSPTTLVLRQEIGSSVNLAPQPNGETPFRNCWLVYAAAFEDGTKATLPFKRALDCLEAYFRGREKSLVYGFLRGDLTKARSVVQAVSSPRVEIEILWATFFHGGIEAGRPRRKVAEAVCGSDSALLLTPFVAGLDKVVKGTPGVDVRSMLAARLAKITVQSLVGKSGRPSLSWGKTLGPPGVGGQPGAAELVYNCVVEREHRGFLSEQEVRAELRKLLGLPTPPDETGAAAMVGKASTELVRLGSDAKKFFSSFSKKKK
mmetsp:Transcript_33281/g.87220  ORF Transcript_33281/g.87220 Transcript_33281/m.87220 type:complete len:634 (+) Transcript_33281:82-1983(+)